MIKIKQQNKKLHTFGKFGISIYKSIHDIRLGAIRIFAKKRIREKIDLGISTYFYGFYLIVENKFQIAFCRGNLCSDVLSQYISYDLSCLGESQGCRNFCFLDFQRGKLRLFYRHSILRTSTKHCGYYHCEK